MERVRHADGVPVVLTKSLLALPDGITLTRSQLENDGLYNLLHRVAGIELAGRVTGDQRTSGRRRGDETSRPGSRIGGHGGPPRSPSTRWGRGIEYVHIIYPEGTELVSDLRGTSVRAATEARG